MQLESDDAMVASKRWSFTDVADTTSVRQDLKRSAVRGFSYTLILSGAELLLRVGFTAVLARLVTPEHFGLVMLVTAVTAIADQFRDVGLSTATIQRERITHQEVSNLFWINAGAGALIALVVSAGSPLIARYFHEPRLIPVTMALATTFVLGGLTVQHEALLARQMRVGPKAAMRLLAFVASSVIAVIMAGAGYGYWALVWREIARSGLTVIGAWALCPWIPGGPCRGTDIRGLLKFGSGLTATYMVGTMVGSLDRFVLGRTQGAGLVGLYRQSYQLVVAPMSQLMGPLYQVSLPSLSMLQDQPARFCHVFTRIVALVALVSMPVGVMVAVWAEECALVILGPEWRGASTFIRIFGIGGVWQSVFSTAGFVLVSRGRAAELLRLTLVQTGSRAILMLVGAAWGGVGVAIADVSSTAVAFVPYMYWALAGSPVSLQDFFRALARPLTASLVLAVAMLVLKLSEPPLPVAITLCSAFVLAALIFPATVIALPGGRADLEALKSLATSVIRDRK